MNKIFGFAAVLLCGLFFAGCSEEDSKVLDDLTGPSDTWCTRPVTYASENGSASTTVNVSFYYASKEVKPNGSLTGLRSDIESIPKDSISVLVTLGSGGTNSLLTTLTKTQYLFKSFGSVKELTSESGTSYEYSNMKLFWKAIYLKNHDELSKDQNKGIPAQLQKSTQSTYSSVSDLENFSWKRLLAAYLLNSLE
ncbi:MAG: hypothetical protein SO037_08535 [Treponema berlinense]|uniref:hypothetical protein n=1 Tax=Treponema berlinense TaxID=225004 RepID=UPI002A7F9F93|nr:hypothetical protein [Treponema berlinense]MDY3708602.1 hypothetical protein [Treponema berlinense]